MMDDTEKRRFRAALGRFATGVTIVTTQDELGAPIGVTANSFNSVSLDPPMVLWSLAKSSMSLSAFSQADTFAVHILACDQQDMSNRFARRGDDKFSGVEFEPGPVPLFTNCAARFICKTAFQYEGGDHIIFVGEVTDFEAEGKPPLLYLEGRYAEARRPGEVDLDEIAPEAVRIGSQSLTHLLARAYTQITRHLHKDLEACSLQQPRLMIMIAIEQHDHPSWEEVCARVQANGYEVSEGHLAELAKLGWVQQYEGRLSLSPEGRTHYFEALSRMRDFEGSFCEGLSDGELAEMRHVLEHIINRTDDGLPTLI